MAPVFHNYRCRISQPGDFFLRILGAGSELGARWSDAMSNMAIYCFWTIEPWPKVWVSKGPKETQGPGQNPKKHTVEAPMFVGKTHGRFQL